jgi:hypothetical protein
LVTGDITVNCGTGRPELQRIADALTKISRQNKLVADQLLALLNELLAIKSILRDLQREDRVQTAALRQIIALLEAGGGAPTTVTRVQDVVKETLARTQQRIAALRVTLTRVEASAGQISIYFEIVNEGVQEIKMMLFGPGSFGNGGSTIIAKGQEILASGIEVAGRPGRGFATTTFIPGITMNGRVDFRAHVTIEEVDVFRLAYAQGNLRPQGRALFKISAP